MSNFQGPGGGARLIFKVQEGGTALNFVLAGEDLRSLPPDVNYVRSLTFSKAER